MDEGTPIFFFGRGGGDLDDRIPDTPIFWSYSNAEKYTGLVGDGEIATGNIQVTLPHILNDHDEELLPRWHALHVLIGGQSNKNPKIPSLSNEEPSSSSSEEPPKSKKSRKRARVPQSESSSPPLHGATKKRRKNKQK